MIIELTKEETQKLEREKFVKHGDYFIVLDNNRYYLTKICGNDDEKWEIHFYKDK